MPTVPSINTIEVLKRTLKILSRRDAIVQNQANDDMKLWIIYFNITIQHIF